MRKGLQIFMEQIARPLTNNVCMVEKRIKELMETTSEMGIFKGLLSTRQDRSFVKQLIWQIK